MKKFMIFLIALSMGITSCTDDDPEFTCSDGIQNGMETAVDCGGDDCDPCPTCFDGTQNGTETGVDCGGDDCDACTSCSDGIQNGTETGVDCGGDCPASCIAPTDPGIIVATVGGETWNSMTPSVSLVGSDQINIIATNNTDASNLIIQAFGITGPGTATSATCVYNGGQTFNTTNTDTDFFTLTKYADNLMSGSFSFKTVYVNQSGVQSVKQVDGLFTDLAY